MMRSLASLALAATVVSAVEPKASSAKQHLRNEDHALFEIDNHGVPKNLITPDDALSASSVPVLTKAIKSLAPEDLETLKKARRNNSLVQKKSIDGVDENVGVEGTVAENSGEAEEKAEAGGDATVANLVKTKMVEENFAKDLARDLNSLVGKMTEHAGTHNDTETAGGATQILAAIGHTLKDATEEEKAVLQAALMKGVMEAVQESKLEEAEGIEKPQDKEAETEEEAEKESGAAVPAYDGAPACVVDMNDVYSCAETEDDQREIRRHLDRRGIVAFTMVFDLAIMLWLAKSFLWWVQTGTQEYKYLSVMFVKCVEQICLLGFVLAISMAFEQTETFAELDAWFFPDKDRERFDLTKFQSHDMREGGVKSEMSIMYEDMHLMVVALMFNYMLISFIVCFTINLKFRKWRRFELEPENEVHVMDNPLEKVDYLLWRRSLVSPMLGQRATELNALRNPVQEFAFTQYLQEVLAQYSNTLFHVPTFGLIMMVAVSAMECFIELQTRSHQQSIVNITLCLWAWIIAATVYIFMLHLQRVVKLLTPPPAALLWYLDNDDGGRFMAPEKHLLPPFRLIPYLKEAPKKTKFFNYWYGTFSPNQQEQLFFRWRKGPGAILELLRNSIFILTLFFTVLVKQLVYVHVDYTSTHFWYPFLSVVAVAVTVFYMLPEAVINLVVASSTGLMVNKPALKQTVSEHQQDHTELSNELMKFAHLASIKDKIEDDSSRESYEKFLTTLYDVTFTDDEKELFIASWKIHNWDSTRGMTPSEVKECMDHLGFEDVDDTIGEWWLVFDNAGTGHLTLQEFERMLMARHLMKYGKVSAESITALFEVDAHGHKVDGYNAGGLASNLLKLNIHEPRLGAAVLLREARAYADQKAGMVPEAIHERLQNINEINCTPKEIGDYMFSNQEFRVFFDEQYVKVMKDRREKRAAARA